MRDDIRVLPGHAIAGEPYVSSVVYFGGGVASLSWFFILEPFNWDAE